MRQRSSASVLALVSGGCDSAIMVAWLARRFRSVHPVYVRFGLAWEGAELAGLRRFLRAARIPGASRLTVLSLPVRDTYGKHWSVTGHRAPGARSNDRLMYLPGRNLLLLSRAAVLAALRRVPVIALGTLKGNLFADASARYRRGFGLVASMAMSRHLTVIAPFGGKRKRDVLRLGRALPLHLTFSCISPVRGRQCGRCNKCAERRRGFADAGLPDHTRYAH
ncbi:MAG: 7-cyano-7-deazaguanine synthase [Candidatus Coatesbacteria bacterium]